MTNNKRQTLREKALMERRDFLVCKELALEHARPSEVGIIFNISPQLVNSIKRKHNIK